MGRKGGTFLLSLDRRKPEAGKLGRRSGKPFDFGIIPAEQGEHV
jgi:hypothetical protein